MVRPGPRTTQDEVKTAVVKLLEQHPEGLNFNEVFRRLKEQKVLGSFSVLSRAIKDLSTAGIVEYKDVQVSGLRIPKRVYMLSDPMVSVLKQRYIEAKKKEKVPLKEILLKEQLLYHLYWTHIVNLISAYRCLLLEENASDENARWKFLLNMEFDYVRAFMNAVAKAVSEGKMPIEEVEKVAHEVQKRLISFKRGTNEVFKAKQIS